MVGKVKPVITVLREIQVITIIAILYVILTLMDGVVLAVEVPKDQAAAVAVLAMVVMED